MKIKLLKTVQIGASIFSAGAEMQVINELGRNLIATGKAVPKDFETSAEVFALERKKSIFDAELIKTLSLPFKQLFEKIPQLTDIDILKEIVNDKRKSIRDAAIKRIETLKP